MFLISFLTRFLSGPVIYRPDGEVRGKARSGNHVPVTAPKDSIILACASLKSVEANPRTPAASGDSRDELKERSRRDRRNSPGRLRLRMGRRLERLTGLVYRAVRQRLEERTIPRGSGSATWKG